MGQYFFGRVMTRQLDFFAFPRTGSHLFRYCTAGLFDLVALRQPNVENPEAIARAEELDPLALYTLGLREDGVPYAPVHFNGRAAGQHGMPAMGEVPLVILRRDLIPTLYSLYRVQRDRWKEPIGDPVAWVRSKAERYAEFDRCASEVLAAHPDRSLLVRFEDLITGPRALERLVEFVGVRPKLSPQIVYETTRFDRFTRSGERTFYRSGNNDAWQQDPQWRDCLERARLPERLC